MIRAFIALGAIAAATIGAAQTANTEVLPRELPGRARRGRNSAVRGCRSYVPDLDRDDDGIGCE